MQDSKVRIVQGVVQLLAFPEAVGEWQMEHQCPNFSQLWHFEPRAGHSPQVEHPECMADLSFLSGSVNVFLVQFFLSMLVFSQASWVSRVEIFC